VGAEPTLEAYHRRPPPDRDRQPTEREPPPRARAQSGPVRDERLDQPTTWRWRCESIWTARCAYGPSRLCGGPAATPMLIPARRRCGSPGPADHHLPLTRLEYGVDHAVYRRRVCTSGWRGCTRCPRRAQTRTTCDSTSGRSGTLMATQPGVLLGANTTRARWPARPQSNRCTIVGHDAEDVGFQNVARAADQR
jgi:hypothetical protein